MNISTLLRCASLALVLCASPAFAKKADESGQTRPEVTGVSDGRVSHDANLKRRGDNAMFVIDLKNICEKRLRCHVSAYLTTSHGPQQIKTVLVLAPQSRGKAAEKSHVTPLRQYGGAASVSHSCRKA